MGSRRRHQSHRVPRPAQRSAHFVGERYTALACVNTARRSHGTSRETAFRRDLVSAPVTPASPAGAAHTPALRRTPRPRPGRPSRGFHGRFSPHLHDNQLGMAKLGSRDPTYGLCVFFFPHASGVCPTQGRLADRGEVKRLPGQFLDEPGSRRISGLHGGMGLTELSKNTCNLLLPLP